MFSFLSSHRAVPCGTCENKNKNCKQYHRKWVDKRCRKTHFWSADKTKGDRRTREVSSLHFYNVSSVELYIGIAINTEIYVYVISETPIKIKRSCVDKVHIGYHANT